jgi:hypothetical protein
MTYRTANRRTNQRCTRVEEHRILAARIRPGHPAAVIDVSPTGALVETSKRLLPGAAVDLFVETAECRDLVRGRVLRCAVAYLDDRSIRYRAAIAFSERLPWLVDRPVKDGYELPTREVPSEARGG